MAPERLPQPGHDKERASPAPGELELVRSALALHDHERGNPDSLLPSTESLDWWLRDRGLVGARERVRESDLRWARDVIRALRATVDGIQPPADRRALDLLNRAALQLHPRFATGSEDLSTDLRGVRGAIARLLGIAFLARRDGTWERLRACSDPRCQAVFYDRSRNRSGRWCSMSTCGNRNKVRSFRERSRVGGG